MSSPDQIALLSRMRIRPAREDDLCAMRQEEPAEEDTACDANSRRAELLRRRKARRRLDREADDADGICTDVAVRAWLELWDGVTVN